MVNQSKMNITDLIADYTRSGWASSMGVRVGEEEGAPGLFLPYQEKNLNADGGVVHGGILATLLHDAGWLEAAAALPEDQSADTLRVVSCQVNYLRAAKGIDLRATAKVRRPGRRFQFVASELQDPQGQAIATAEMVFGVNGKPSTTQMDASLLSSVRESSGENKILQMFNLNLSKRLPGMTVMAMSDGYCGIKVSNLSHFHDRQGNLASGVQLLAADNAGVFASFSLGKRPSKASTVELKMAFCDTPSNEDIFVVGRTVSHADDVIFNRLDVYGETSLRLLAYGTMTFLC